MVNHSPQCSCDGFSVYPPVATSKYPDTHDSSSCSCYFRFRDAWKSPLLSEECGLPILLQSWSRTLCLHWQVSFISVWGDSRKWHQQPWFHCARHYWQPLMLKGIKRDNDLWKKDSRHTGFKIHCSISAGQAAICLQNVHIDVSQHNMVHLVYPQPQGVCTQGHTHTQSWNPNTLLSLRASTASKPFALLFFSQKGSKTSHFTAK